MMFVVKFRKPLS